MSLTKIDCHFFRGSTVSADRSGFVALNPHALPGSLVMAGASAVRASLGSHVAFKLALEHFTEGLIEYFSTYQKQNLLVGNSAEVIAAPAEISLEALEHAFKSANNSVYSFGHKLAAGGRLSAALMGVVVEDNLIAAGRVGPGNIYLIRQGEIFPFFEGGAELEESEHENLVGSQSVISVELASVPAEQEDTILMLSRALDDSKKGELSRLMRELEPWSPDSRYGQDRPIDRNPCAETAQLLFPEAQDLAFAMMAVIGPNTIYLKEAV
ncbi:MAG: hypothetical protein DCC75_03730 [Proteobacteria bacterium]|nr:MAG: hypothetical protein DCC75_03730 [Pseudomonadota bacterium]